MVTKGVFSRSSALEKHLHHLSHSVSVNIKWYYDLWKKFWEIRQMVELINRNGKFDKYMNKLKIKYRD